MVSTDKQKIINKQGSPVTITNVSGQVTTTKSLIGRASTQFNSLLSLEAHRRGHFLPTCNLDSGFTVHNTILNEDYLCVAVYSELFINKVTSTVAHMLLCNGLLTVKRDGKTADDRGKVTSLAVDVVTNKKIYLQKLTQDLKLFDAGLSPTAEYIMYAPVFDIQLLDKVIVTNGIQTLNFKVDAINKITYPGVVEIQLRFETRG